MKAALLGALTLGAANVAVADRDRDRYHDRHGDRYDNERVLDSKRLRKASGRVEFDVAPGLHRDGLMLATDGRIGVSKVQFVYEDGNTETLRGHELARMPQDYGTLTIQTGRPGGLRHVRVWYHLSSRRGSTELQLVSFGDGYTDKVDRRDLD